MANGTTRRALLVPVLALAHLAVVAVILLQPFAMPDRPAAAAMMVMAIPAPGETAESLVPPPIGEIAALVDPPEFDVAPSDVNVAAGPCALAENVEAALRSDPRVGRAIARIPVAARSVSNALLLWDGAWATPASIGGTAALVPIRAAVEAQVRAAPAPCRDEAVVGPRLVVVPGSDRPIVLAFGSGRWRWAEIL